MIYIGYEFYTIQSINNLIRLYTTYITYDTTQTLGHTSVNKNIPISTNPKFHYRLALYKPIGLIFILKIRSSDILPILETQLIMVC